MLPRARGEAREAQAGGEARVTPAIAATTVTVAAAVLLGGYGIREGIGHARDSRWIMAAVLMTLSTVLIIAGAAVLLIALIWSV